MPSSAVKSLLIAIAASLTLAACGDAFDGPPMIPGRPLWQNAPANATYEPADSRPPGS